MTGPRALTAPLSVLVVAIASAAGICSAARLPSSRYGSSSEVLGNSWWVRVDDHVYRAPPATEGLSLNVSDYYYAVGGRNALTDDLKTHRVGGEGQLHLFHLPSGASSLPSTPKTGDRRSSMSSFLQLRHGLVLKGDFPKFMVANSYKSFLSSQQQSQESAVVASLTVDVLTAYLTGLTSLPSAASPTRCYKNKAATKVVQDYLLDAFKAMGLSTCVQSFAYEGTSFPQKNIMAVLPGSSRTAGTISLGAHYDSRPYEGTAPGVNDNGSGVAAMLAIAKAFAEAGIKPTRTIYFVGFAAEEPGLVGSTAFANALKSGTLGCNPAPVSSFLAPGDTKKEKTGSNIALVLDEVGWRNPLAALPTLTLESHENHRAVMEHLASSNAKYNNISLTVNFNPFGSDHISFLHKGDAAVLSINGNDDAYPDYHKLTDTVDRIDTALMLGAARMNCGALYRLSGAAFKSC